MNKENAQVKWFKAGVEILPDDAKYKFLVEGNQYSLQIFDCQLDDANDYAIVCRGRKCAAQLEVKGKIITLEHLFIKKKNIIN
jgi:hypothetical protein